MHHPHHKKKQERKTTKKQVPHPHQPLVLVEKGEKAIEKYLTESNCRNGKQITDQIRHNFGKKLDYLGKLKQLDLSILNIF